MVILTPLVCPCPKFIIHAGFEDINFQHLLYEIQKEILISLPEAAILLNLPDQNTEFYIEILKKWWGKREEEEKKKTGIAKHTVVNQMQ